MRSCSPRHRTSLDPGWVEQERSRGDGRARALDLREHVGDVDAAMLRRERGQAARRLLELARGGDRTPALRLVPGDRDVDEALVEITLLRGRGTPHELQLLVRLEEPAGADVTEALLV